MCPTRFIFTDIFRNAENGFILKIFIKTLKKGFTKELSFDIILRLTMSADNFFPEKGLSAERDQNVR